MSFVDTGMNGQGIIHPGRTRGSKGVVHVFGVITLALLASLLLLCATGPASADVNVTRVEVTPTMREVEPGGVGTYFVTIDVNVSGGAADVTAEVNNGTGEWNGWDAWIVGHGQTRTWYNVSGDRTWHLTINISVPSVADVDSNPFVATLSVTPTSGEANNVSWETRVRQVHAISVEPDWTALYVDRGEQAIYDLNISNLGNGEDTVTIEYRTNSSDIDLAGPGTRTISVGGNAIVSLYATTHEWTEPGAHTIDVVVTSEDNVTVASVQLELTVNATYGIRLWSPASIKTGGFGENVTFGLNVENRGDGSDLAHLVVHDSPLDGDITFTLSPAEGVRELDVRLNTSSTTRLVTVTVAIPDRDVIVAMFGNDTVAFAPITIRAVSSNDTGAVAYVNLTVRFRPITDMSTEDVDAVATVDPNVDGNATFSFRLWNDGTGGDTYTMDVVDRPLWLDVAPDYAGTQVDPHTSVLVGVTATLPADPDSIVPGVHTIVIRITSESEDTVVRYVTLTLNVTDFALGFELTGVTTRQVLRPDLGIPAAFSLRILNKGTRDDAYTVDLLDNPFPGRLLLAHDYDGGKVVNGDDVLVAINATPTGSPHLIRAGNYSLTVRVTSESNVSLRRNLTLDLDVAPFHRMEVVSGDRDRGVEPGTATWFVIGLRNRGNDADVLDITATTHYPSVERSYLVVNGTGGPGTTHLGSVPVAWAGTITVEVAVNLTLEDAVEMFDPSSNRTIHMGLDVISVDGARTTIALNATVAKVHRLRAVLLSDRTLVISSGNADGDAFRALPAARIDVVNTGNAPDGYVVTWDVGADLNVSMGMDPISGPINDTLHLNVSVGLARGMLPHVPPGTYPLNITIRSAAEIDQVATVSLDVLVEAIEALNVSMPVTNTTVVLGRNVSYRLRLSNLGNAPDQVVVALTDPGSAALGDLRALDAVNVSGSNVLNLTLAPGASDLVEYHVHADEARVRADLRRRIFENISVQSGINGAVRRIPIVTTVIGDERVVALEIPHTDVVEATPIAGGNASSMTAWVTNMGFETDSYTVLVSARTPVGQQRAGDPEWIILSSSGREGTTIELRDLDATERRNVTVRVALPLEPLEIPTAEYVYNLEARGVDADPESEPGAFEKLPFSVIVGPVRTFELSVDRAGGEIYPLGWINDSTRGPRNLTFLVRVRNTGNERDSYTVSTSDLPANLTALFGLNVEESFWLDPGQESELHLNIRARGMTPGRYDLTVRAFSEWAGDRTETLGIEIRAPRIEVSPADIRLEGREGHIRQGNFTRIIVRVWNNGTAPVEGITVTATLDGETVGTDEISWINASDHHDAIIRWRHAPGGNVTLTFTLKGEFGEIVVMREFSFIPSEQRPTFEVAASLLVGLAAGLLGGLLLAVLLSYITGTPLIVALGLSRRRSSAGRPPSTVPRRRPPAPSGRPSMRRIPTRPRRPPVRVIQAMDLSPGPPRRGARSGKEIRPRRSGIGGSHERGGEGPKRRVKGDGGARRPARRSAGTGKRWRTRQEGRGGKTTARPGGRTTPPRRTPTGADDGERKADGRGPRGRTGGRSIIEDGLDELL